MCESISPPVLYWFYYCSSCVPLSSSSSSLTLTIFASWIKQRQTTRFSIHDFRIYSWALFGLLLTVYWQMQLTPSPLWQRYQLFFSLSAVFSVMYFPLFIFHADIRQPDPYRARLKIHRRTFSTIIIVYSSNFGSGCVGLVQKFD